MADDKTKIETEYNFTSKGVDELLKKVDKLEKGLTNVADAATKILNSFEKLSKVDVNKINYTNINPNQTQIRTTHGQVTYAHGDKNSRESANKIIEKIEAEEEEYLVQLQEKNEKLRKDNENYDKILENSTKSAAAYKLMAETSSKTAPSRIADAQRRREQFELNKPLYQMRHDHPEWFISNSHNPRYQFGKGIANLGENISRYGVGGRMIGDAMNIIGNSVMSPALGASAALTKLGKALGDFTKSAIQNYSEIEAIKTNLNVVYGSQSQSDAAFQEISQYAVKSPFGVKETSEIAILLKQSGVYATDLMDTIKMLGDTAGGNMEKMKRIANNYAQIVSIGKASMLDMRQFAYAGIPIFEAVSEELKVSQQQLRKMISDGQVTSDIIEKVFKNLTGINGIFENATQKGAETLKARLQNLKDSKQLAMSAVGERLVNSGTKTGKDSYVLNMVGIAESFYNGLQKWADGKNIQRDVKTIATRNAKIDELKQLIEYNKSQGNKEVVEALEKALANELSKKSLEAERSSYNASYESKMGYYSSRGLSYDNINAEDISKDITDIETEIKKLSNEAYLALNDYTKNSKYKDYSDEERVTLASSLRQKVLELSAALDSLKEVTKTTAEEIKANRETRTIQTQQSIYDLSGKMVSRTGSAFNTASEIKAAMANTDEAKKKAEEEQKKKWTETIELMKQIQGTLDDKGVLDFTKVRYADFMKYFNSGAIESGRKLNVVNTENKKQMAEDRKLLQAQMNYAQEQILLQLPDSLKTQFRNIFGKRLTRNAGGITDEQYLTGYQEVLDKQIKLLETEEGTYDELINYLKSTSIQWSGDKTALENVDINSLFKSSSDGFIPLWKRILSGATGITTMAMTSTKDTLDNYTNDMAIRNITSSVLSAMLKSGGTVQQVQKLLKTNGTALELKGDKGGTYQIDWLATKKALKDFSLQLSASTSVITAYKSGLQAELDVYEKLLSEGLTSAESQDLKQGKYVTAKQMEKLQQDYGSQLVNAFGEILQTESGIPVKFENGQFVDEEGNSYAQEQIIVTGNIYKILQERLGKTSGEVAQASVRERSNQIIKDLIGDRSERLTNRFLQGYSTLTPSFDNQERMYRVANFAASNPQYITSNFNDLMDARLKDTYYNKGDFSSVKEVLSAAENDMTELGDTARTWIDQILAIIQGEIDTLTGSDEYQKAVSNAQERQKIQDQNAIMGEIASRKFNPNKYDFNEDLSKFGESSEYNLLQKKAFELAGMPDTSTFEELADLISGCARGTEEWNKALEDVRKTVGKNGIEAVLEQLANEVKQIVDQTSKDSFLTPFKYLGEAIVDADSASENLKQNWKQIAAGFLQNLGTSMATAGFNIAASAAAEHNWGLAIAGLALAGAGGVASGLGTAVNNASKDQDKNKDELSKLNSLKDQMVDLLEQARQDALYYENNLRHKTALDINRKVSNTNVHDALISTNGRVITTDPKDYLIATKNPRELVGGNTVVKPVINNIIHNNAGVQISQQQTVNQDGSIDIETFIENKIGDYIATSKSDDAFAARQARVNGHRGVM